jgi:hypothetical protein
MEILDLTSLESERIFVIGALDGDYKALIDILYEQNFNYKDLLILTGNFLNQESSSILDIIYFIKDNKNCYSVKGKQEIDFLLKYAEDSLPEFLKEICNQEVITFLDKLPLCIKLDSYIVVSKGLEPNKSLQEQNEEAFYLIPHFDTESRYYQFSNEDKKSWFDFEFPEGKVCFSDIDLEEIQVEAGFNLKNSEAILSSLIIIDNDQPIIIN